MKILLKIILFFISIFVFGENTSISGFVREKNTGEPISYANVFLSNKSFGSATNQDGYFVVSNVPFGNYELNGKDKISHRNHVLDEFSKKEYIRYFI